MIEEQKSDNSPQRRITAIRIETLQFLQAG
jgi:hypothetical protein